jgi:PAS domain S-box-containing protein
MQARLAENEAARIQALRKYAILDTSDEPAFDRITRLAARLTGTPITLLTLVDEDRQWFKSTYGFEPRETPREVSFCAHAILSNDVMVVPDATADRRFATNALVTGEPRIRFYAGAPLRTPDGLNLGTLCAIDTVPRQFSADDQRVLADLAALAMDELQLRIALREKSQHMAAIDNLRAGVLVTDPLAPDNPIIFCNPGFSNMTGYSAEEITGRNCRFLQGPETDPAMVAEIRKAIQERRLFQGIIRNRRKNGEVFWNDLLITPVFDLKGDLINFVGLQQDVTEVKNAQDALAASYVELRKLQELRDNLTHMIVHDLRSPLTGVIGYLDLFKRRSAPKLDQKELSYIETASKAAEQLNEMITSLLDTNRLESGEMPLDCGEHDIPAIVRAAIESLASAMGERKLTTEIAGGNQIAFCDADLVRRVVSNLLTNALKFTPARGSIAVRVAPNNGAIEVSVSDTGPGIPAEEHVRIFEKFGQVGNGTRHSTGLGLTFCKLAVEAQSGTIGVQSAPGEGSRFWFTLPRPKSAEAGPRHHSIPAAS